MTSPAYVVLMLALVCSTYCKTPEQTADQASKHAVHTNRNRFESHTSQKMRPLTNNHNFIVNNLNVNKIENIIPKIINSKNDFNEINKDIEIGHKVGTEHKTRIRNGKLDDILKATPNIKEYYDKYKHKDENFDKIVIKTTEVDEIYTGSATEYYNAENKRSQINVRSKTTEQHYTEDNEFFNKQILNKGVSFVSSQAKYINSNERRMRNFNVNDHNNNNNKKFRINFKRAKRDETDKKPADKCEEFGSWTSGNKIYHPHDSLSPDNKNYYSNITCVLVLEANKGEVITLTFVDVFHIEYHPNCAYDYLEIRDGKYGYANPFGRYCGEVFPPQLTSTGPFMWLKFKADETIEYEGFTIEVQMVNSSNSHKIPDSCYVPLTGVAGTITNVDIDEECKSGSKNHALDVLWTITTAEDTDIYLNFTVFELAKPNECEHNVLQVFGYVTEDDTNNPYRLAHYCGSAANAVSTRIDGKPTPHGNVMHVRLYMSQVAIKNTKVNATFTAFRTMNPAVESKCKDHEFNCEDNTCIDLSLRCNNYAHCRLKADEDPSLCDNVQQSLIGQAHILVILVIFSLILSGMSFVFLFKCIRKLYQDHKAIKEHIRQSTEDRLDTLITGSKLILDPKGLRDQPRASLERENHTNELYKQQRSISQHKGLPQQTSIDSDFQDTHLDLDDEPWQRNVEAAPEPQDAKVKRAERNGKIRRSDTSKKEETIRSRKESIEEKKEIRDAAVGAPDTKESGCQTRESLFQADTAPSSDGSNSASNSRGFSTFGYSGATLVRPSPPPAPPAPAVSSVQIELLRQIPSFETPHKSTKKLPDRRPMSAETTRSAPDVIIVSKPIR